MIYIVNIILAFVIANTLGKKRHIGFGWSLFVCLTLTVLFGYIITTSSEKDDKPRLRFNKTAQTVAYILGSLFIVTGLIGIYRDIVEYYFYHSSPTRFYFIPALGFAGFGIYIAQNEETISSKYRIAYYFLWALISIGVLIDLYMLLFINTPR